MKHHIHAFVLVAFLLVGISPACQFISGGKLFEICSLDSTYQAEVDPALLDYLPKEPKQDQKHETKPQCGFCFAQTHLKTAKTTVLQVVMPQMPVLALSSFEAESQAKDSAYNPFAPRGPPHLFV